MARQPGAAASTAAISSLVVVVVMLMVLVLVLVTLVVLVLVGVDAKMGHCEWENRTAALTACVGACVPLVCEPNRQPA